MTSNIYNEVLLDHNLHPLHLHELPCATCSNDGLNPTCGDSLTLHLNIEDGIIKDGSFTGVGCAISQASTDIMLDLIIGRSPEEAKHLGRLFGKMIGGEITEDELEELEEAGALQNISKMPARVKCATLGWKTLEKMLEENT
ncbi:MAG: SUF system NifU family Fe-S cluster assembly protein [Ruminococcus sp.]|nr:SUF system NifU family Fe-S cluster assembly protein [Ruminococcus sp.]MCR5143336.1 SUF system NifU family Fe-S cluster assembly protein [Ruminococcus sp.]